MIDCSCNILPNIDDGARDLATSVEKARVAAANGIEAIACTPRIFPGVSDNERPALFARISDLSARLADRGPQLQLVSGVDVHAREGLAAGIKAGRVLTLAGSRYLLLEPPHQFPPPGFQRIVLDIMSASHHPILTHPDRLAWIEDDFDVFKRLTYDGVWIQITVVSLIGQFWRSAKYWAERMLAEGLADIIATDAGNSERRSPLLPEVRRIATNKLGETEAMALVKGRPQTMLSDVAPATCPPPPALADHSERGRRKPAFWTRG